MAWNFKSSVVALNNNISFLHAALGATIRIGALQRRYKSIFSSAFGFASNRNRLHRLIMMESTKGSNNSKSNDEMVSIDGSKGEGGGQILRNSVSFAAIMSKSVDIARIRYGRSKPGMKAQHVKSLQLIQQICDGQLIGDKNDSTQVTYHPPPQAEEEEDTKSKDNDDNNKNNNDHNHDVRTIIGDTGTAGSICLLLQAAIPCALFGTSTKCKFILRGGTNASMAPQYDYWEKVFLPILQQQFGLKSNFHIKPSVLKRGFFPKGGGEVHVITNPLSSSASLLPLPSITLTDRGILSEIYIRSFHAGKIPKHMAIDMAKAAKSHLIKNLIKSINSQSIQKQYEQKGEMQPERNQTTGGRKRTRGRRRQKGSNSYNNDNDNSQSTASNNTSNNNANKSSGKHDIEISQDVVTESNAVGNGLGIIIIGKTTTGCLLAGSALGSSRPPFKKPKEVAMEAVEEFCSTYSDGGCVDEWLQDQLILFMALAEGTSNLLTGSLTLHTQTAMWIAEEFTGAKFAVAKVKDDNDNVGNDTAGSINNDVSSKDVKEQQSFTPFELLSLSSNGNGKEHDIEYGEKGRMVGKYLIQCEGIGYVPSEKQ